MELLLNDDQRLYQKTFSDFVSEQCPYETLRHLEKTELGYSKEIWQKMAELGFLGIGIDEKYGGAGGDAVDITILYEQLGRTLLPSPHFSTVILGAGLIGALGNDAQKADLLAKITSGHLIIAAALGGLELNFGKTDIRFKKTATSFSLTGKDNFVEYAQQADLLLVAAKSESDKDISLFYMPTNAQGLQLTKLQTMDRGKFYQISLNGVSVPKEAILGEEGSASAALNKMKTRARVAQAAKMMGACQGDFDLTLRYAKERVQFGQRIALFQDIYFRLADMTTFIEGARLFCYRTAWKIANDLPFEQDAAMLKSNLNEVYRYISDDCVQIHGGFGYMEESNPQFYYRRAITDLVRLGSTEEMLEEVAQGMRL